MNESEEFLAEDRLIEVLASEVIALRTRLAEVERERNAGDSFLDEYHAHALSWRERAEAAEARIESLTTQLSAALTQIKLLTASKPEIVDKMKHGGQVASGLGFPACRG